MNTETAKQQRLWAREVKKRAYTVKNTCDRNAGEYKPIISVDYMAEKLMEEIIDELTKAAELQGAVIAMADEIMGKGGEK